MRDNNPYLDSERHRLRVKQLRANARAMAQFEQEDAVHAATAAAFGITPEELTARLCKIQNRRDKDLEVDEQAQRDFAGRFMPKGARLPDAQAVANALTEAHADGRPVVRQYRPGRGRRERLAVPDVRAPIRRGLDGAAGVRQRVAAPTGPQPPPAASKSWRSFQSPVLLHARALHRACSFSFDSLVKALRCPDDQSVRIAALSRHVEDTPWLPRPPAATSPVALSSWPDTTARTVGPCLSSPGCSASVVTRSPRRLTSGHTATW